MTIYRKYGNVMIPPHEIFDDPDNWGDEANWNWQDQGNCQNRWHDRSGRIWDHCSDHHDIFTIFPFQS
jgi:hypothetical protein